MKFHAAVTKEPVTLRHVGESNEVRVFPADTKASAVKVGPSLWHLNVTPEQWVTFEGNVFERYLEIGEVIATCNEPESKGSER